MQYTTRKTYPQLGLDPLRLVVEGFAVPAFSIGGGGVVVERVGRPRHSGVLDQPREVLPAQKTEDATHLVCVSRSTRHHRPVAAQVIKINC